MHNYPKLNNMKNLLHPVNKVFTTLFIFISLSGNLFGAGITWYVTALSDSASANGSFSFPFESIQRGVDSATSGDTILISGTFYLTSDIVIANKVITLKSYNGGFLDVIDGQTLYGISVSGTSDNTVIDGMYFSNCPTAINCVATSPVIMNCYFYYANYGINSTTGATPQIFHNIFNTCLYGVAFDDTNVSLNIVNNTFYGSDLTGGYTAMQLPLACTGTVKNNIVSNYESVYIQGTGALFIYNNYFSYTGTPDTTNNIVANPAFTDLYYFTIDSTSPCFNAGDPSMIDSDSTRVDIGAVPFIVQPKLTDFAYTFTNPCSLGTNGTIQFTFTTGGSGSFQYLVNGIDLGTFHSGLSSGNYELIVKDLVNINDSVVKNITLIDLPAIAVSVMNIVQPSDSFSSNGSFDVLASGGSASGYYYSIYGNNTSYSYGDYLNSFYNIPADNYTITVSDDAGCSGTANYTLNSMSGGGGGPGYVNVQIDWNYTSCANPRWNFVLSNNSDLVYSSAPYTNMWILDNDTIMGFYVPDTAFTAGSEHDYMYIVDSMGVTVGSVGGHIHLEKPVISSGSGLQLCPNEKVQLGINTYVYAPTWDFGDSSKTEMGNNYTSHSFATPGMYKVKATFYDACSNIGSDSLIITVSNSAVPSPVFYLQGNKSYCPNDNVEFNTSGDYASYTWTIEGVNYNGFNVVHQFPTSGTYYIQLDVINKCGQSGTKIDSVQIIDSIVPWVDFSFHDDYSMACVTTPVVFDANSPGTYIDWDFGDGFFGSGKSIVHTYDSVGTYNVTLTITNGCGYSNFITKQVYASPSFNGLNVNIYPEMNNGPIGTIGIDSAYVCKGSTVKIRSNTSNKTSNSYEWYVNDVYSSSDPNEYLLYSLDTASLVVKLKVNSGCGISDSASFTVIFTDTIKPVSVLGMFPPSVCAGEKVYFWDENSYYGTGNYYELIDGAGYTYTSTGIVDSSTHSIFVYPIMQSQKLTFKVTNSCGQTIQRVDSVVVSLDPNSIPFYFVDNATRDKNNILDYSKQNYPTDTKVNITLSMSSFTAGMNQELYLFFWYGAMDMNSQPNGMVKVIGTDAQIQTGINVVAYVPFDDGNPNTFEYAAGYYCNAKMALMDQPDAMINGTVLPLSPGGVSNLSPLDIPAPTCINWKVVGSWYGTSTKGVQIELKFYSDSTYDIIDINNSMNISSGTFLDYLDSIVFSDQYYCNLTATYLKVINADTLILSTSTDTCTERKNALTGGSLTRQYQPNKNYNAVCTNDAVRFNAVGGVNYIWDFGDGTSEVAVSPVHRYKIPGMYDAFVQITNGCGRVDTIHTPVEISTDNKPKAFFWMDMNNMPQVGVPVHFYAYNMNATNDNNISDFKWYADGYYFGNTKDIAYEFLTPGLHMVSLVATNGCGSDSVSQPINVMANSCFASFWITKINEYEYTFEAAQNGATIYHWDFGDGTYFDTTASIVSHKFASAGYSYLIYLTVNINATSCTNNQYLYINGDCKAGFDVASIDEVSRQIVLVNHASNASQVYWYFDDGYDSYENTDTVKHTYSYAGKYVISQTVNDTLGCNTSDYEIVILPDFDCNIYFYSEEVGSLTQRFSAYSYSPTDTVKTWSWDFGDGQTANGFIVNHTYGKAGYYTVVLSAQGSKCNSSYESWVYASGIACDTPYFTTTMVADTNYTFDIINPKAGVVYTWSFGDGSNYETDTSVSHIFATDNLYYIEVWSTDTINDCSSYTYKELKIGNVGCWSSFWQINDSANRVVFYNYSSTGKYYWSFGDGTFSREFEPVHEYKTAGLYNVCLTVTDSAGTCTKKVCSDIVAGKADCKADFSFSVDANGNATFKDLSTGIPTSYYWSFGDWNYSYEQNPVNQYVEAGIYDVYFAVYNDISGCYDEIVKSVKVGTVAEVTYASFSWYLDDDNKTVYFTDASTSNVTKWYWTFGDGNYVEGKDVTHVYAKPGLYEVCLKVFNGSTGLSTSYCEQILIGEAPCTAVADFAYIIDNKTNSVRFTNKSNGDYDAQYWSFDDGTTSNEINPNHTFTKPGFYLVSLAVRKKDSDCSDFYADFIQVGAVECRADFDYIVDGTAKTVTLSNKSKSADAMYFWTFDDGDNSTEKNPVHAFSYPGIHYIGLTVADSSGLCMDYTTREVQVGEVTCNAHFSYYVDKATNKAFCKNEAIGASTEYYWYFGDGAQSTDTSPVHQFNYPGYYIIALNTFDAITGCMDYYEELVPIGDAGIDCEADFIYQVNNSEVTFRDNSKGDINKYVWNFGDGVTSILKDPTHTYTQGGYYNVCLTVVNTSSIPNITCQYVEVAATASTDCKAKFIYSVDSATKTVSFVDRSLGEPNKYDWAFGDDSVSTVGPNIKHTYKNPGYYLVSLQIGNAGNCLSKDYGLINVNMPDTGFVVSFGYDVLGYDKKAGGYPVDFVGAGLGDQARLRWDFGDTSATSIDTTTNNPTHVYANAGDHTVCLTYADPVTNKTSTTCQVITTATLCQADLEPPFAKCKTTELQLDQAGVVNLNPMAIDNSSTDDCGIVDYTPLPNQFTAAGPYNVKLVVTDNKGNKDTCEVGITVKEYVGINNQSIASIFSVYPNPFAEQLTLTYYMLQTADVEIDVYDMLGKIVTKYTIGNQLQGTNKYVFDTRDIKSGSYFIQLKTANGLTQKQLIMKK